VGGSFETDSVDYSVRKKYSLQLVQFYQGKVFLKIKKFASKNCFLQNQVPFFDSLLLEMTIVPEEMRSVND